VLAAVIIALYDLLIHYQTVLVHHWFKHINDALFLLCVVPNFRQSDGVYLADDWHQKLAEHAITKVTFDDYLIHIFLLRYSR